MIEAQIQERIKEFDIDALLHLLQHIGYTRNSILFKSNFTVVSPASLLESIEFLPEPTKRAIITLNLGLLSGQSPLPSYFFKTLENDHIDEKALVDFLEFFNHTIIQNYIDSILIENNSTLFPNWEHTKRAYLRLAGVNSVSILHRLFCLVFPELGIDVSKRKHQRTLKNQGIRLGYTKLSDSFILGTYTKVPITGFDVTLYCDEEHNRKDTWAEKISKRLYGILFPILQEKLIDLKVVLVIRSQKGWVQLRQESYLGIDKIKGGIEKNRLIVIFNGEVSRNTKRAVLGQAM